VAYKIDANGLLIGESDLEDADQGMGLVRGRFRPNAAYAEVQPIFRKYADAIPNTSALPTDEALLQQYYRQRDELALRIVDASGSVVPTTSIHIYDFTYEAGADALEVDVIVADPAFWESRRPRD
jgi:hypothetical protein